MNPYVFPGIKVDMAQMYRKMDIPITQLQTYVDQAFKDKDDTVRMQKYKKFVLAWLARKYTYLSLTQIGKHLKTTHSNVIYAIRQIDNYISINDPLLLPIIRKAEAQIFLNPLTPMP